MCAAVKWLTAKRRSGADSKRRRPEESPGTAAGKVTSAP